MAYKLGSWRLFGHRIRAFGKIEKLIRSLGKRGWRNITKEYWNRVRPTEKAVKQGARYTVIFLDSDELGTQVLSVRGHRTCPKLTGLTCSEVRHYFYGMSYGSRVWMYSYAPRSMAA